MWYTVVPAQLRRHVDLLQHWPANTRDTVEGRELPTREYRAHDSGRLRHVRDVYFVPRRRCPFVRELRQQRLCDHLDPARRADLPAKGVVEVVQELAVVLVIVGPLVVGNAREHLLPVLRVVVVHRPRYEPGAGHASSELRQVPVQVRLIDARLRLLLQQSDLLRQHRQPRAGRRVARHQRRRLVVRRDHAQQLLGSLVVLGRKGCARDHGDVAVELRLLGQAALGLLDDSLRLLLHEAHLLRQQRQPRVGGGVTLDRVDGRLVDCEHTEESRRHLLVHVQVLHISGRADLGGASQRLRRRNAVADLWHRHGWKIQGRT
mmetsp:Transcript_39303/g.128510  ORF Transcript_39303/g.128510 Transcript_39303/m.128510 type:complete len:319 (-) Transcript_39303:6-962(-)